MTAQLWIDGPLPGLNEMLAAAKGAGGVGRHYAKLKRQWTETVWALAKSARLPSFPGRVALSFDWREPNTRRDPDNICAGKKLAIDGLVTAGVLAGDGWKVVVSLKDTFVVDPGFPGVMVTIESASPTVLMEANT